MLRLLLEFVERQQFVQREQQWLVVRFIERKQQWFIVGTFIFSAVLQWPQQQFATIQWSEQQRAIVKWTEQ